MKTLDRYLVSEMLGPFFVGVIGFILVLVVDLLFTMADLIINRGIPFFTVVRLLIYRLPSLLVMTFPVSTIFGATMAIGRLSKDNEIVALRTSGVNIYRIAAPILAVGLVVSFLSFLNNEHLVPRANYIANNLIRQMIYSQPLPEVKENLFFKDQHNRFYYARSVDTKKKEMRDIMVYEVKDGRYPRVIIAESANFSGHFWQLGKGVIHKYDDQGRLAYEADFQDLKLNVYEDVLNYTEQKGYADMNIKELRESLSAQKKGGVDASIVATELFLKFATPLACLVFAIIGVPFSLTSPRAGRTWGLVVTIVFMFTYYVFASVFRSLGRGGIVPPPAAAFVPPLSFLLIGILLLVHEGRSR